MSTIEHQTDQVEAYALGVLEPPAQASFETHIAECTDCRQLAQTTEETAHMLALVAQPAAPPLRCKRMVLGRIEREQFLRSPTPRRATRRVPLSTWTAIAAVCALMLTGGWAWSLQTQLAQLQNTVALQATQTAQMQQSLGQVINYTTDGEQVCLMQHANAKAKCLARPGENQALMVVSGLAPLPAGQTYQVWLANDQHQAPLSIFNTKPDGSAEVPVAPREALDQFDAVMITVEQAGGSQTPSKQQVLAGQFR